MSLDESKLVKICSNVELKNLKSIGEVILCKKCYGFSPPVKTPISKQGKFCIATRFYPTETSKFNIENDTKKMDTCPYKNL